MLRLEIWFGNKTGDKEQGDKAMYHLFGGDLHS